ncbi:tetratricopeptide repeat protein, partial [bacterium]|nr:tetratricopeptide repeat protein [bacterium]
LKKYAKIQAVWNDLKPEYKENEDLMYILSKSLTDDKKNILIKILEKNLENRLALLDYAEIAIEENNFNLSLDLLLKAKNLKDDFAVEFRLGYTYFNLAEYQKSIDAYLRALEFNPTSDKVYYELASAYIENFWYDEALIAVNRSIELAKNEEDIDSRKLLCAWLNHKIGKSDKAKIILDSFQIDSKLYEDSKILKYVISYSEGDVVISKLQLEILLRSNPENPLIISTLGKIYKQMQHAARAIEIYNKGLEISPNSIEFMSELADLYIDINDFKNAWELIDRLEKINNRILAIYNSKARIYYREKEYEKAYAELKKYIDLDKNNAEVYYFAGLILNDNNKPEQAIEHLETAIRLSPGIGKYYSQIAKSYEIMGKMEIAMTWAKEACIVSENDPLFLERAYELARAANFEEDIRSFEVRLKYFKSGGNRII